MGVVVDRRLKKIMIKVEFFRERLNVFGLRILNRMLGG